MQITDLQLSQLLLDNQFLNQEEIKSALESARMKSSSLYEAILDKDLLSDENIGKLVADFLKLPFINLAKTSISPETLKIIPSKIAESEKVIAYLIDKNGLNLATSYPQNKELFEMIAQKAGLKYNLHFTTDRAIEETLSLYKRDLESAFGKLLETEVSEAGKNIQSDAPVTKIFDTLIEYAYDNKASDVHIEPEENQSITRFRIDGILHDVLKLPKVLHSQIVTRIKVLAKLRTDEHLSAQDGKLRMVLPREELDIRVSIVPIVAGEKVVLRLLTSHFRQFGLSDLGMGDKDLEKVKKGFTRPYGMILSTGPTGSGKTTSMYAILKILNTRERNIATIEDPVEYEIEGINQIQVNPKTNLTFAEGLRSILRQDPDIVYVGEIRDEETADIAINSAMTGHLVLSTLHTNDAATSLPRLIDMGVEPFLVASSVNVIVGQRLVRKICDRCRVSYPLKTVDLEKSFSPEIIKRHFGIEKEIRLYYGKGCPVCHNTGYVGRVGVFEVLTISDEIKKLIVQKADSEIITKQAVTEGMTTMMEDGLSKVQQGVTTIEEVLRTTKE